MNNELKINMSENDSTTSSLHTSLLLNIEKQLQPYVKTNLDLSCDSTNKYTYLLQLDSKQLTTTSNSIMDKYKQNSSDKIVFVIDTSSSMSPFVKHLVKVLQLVIDKSHHEQIGMVTFNYEANVLFPMTFISDTNKESIKEELKHIKVDGATNLYAGLEKGLDVLWHDQKEDSGENSTSTSTTTLTTFNSQRRRYMVVLTDGKTNLGKTEEEMLSNLKDMPFIQQTDIYCMAIGDRVNRLLLESIVTNHSGRLYSIEHEKEIATSFGDCMGSIMSVTTTDACLSIKSPFKFNVHGLDNVVVETSSFSLSNPSISQILISSYHTKIHIGTMFVDDHRDFLFTVYIPENVNSDTLTASIEVSYKDKCTGQTGVIVKDLHTVSKDNVNYSIHPVIQKHFWRIQVAKCVDVLSESDVTEEKSIETKKSLKEIKEIIMKEEPQWKEDPLCQELITVIDQVMKNRKNGMFCRQLSMGLSLQRQTTVTGRPSIYTTPLQQELSQQYETLTTDHESDTEVETETETETETEVETEVETENDFTSPSFALSPPKLKRTHAMISPHSNFNSPETPQYQKLKRSNAITDEDAKNIMEMMSGRNSGIDEKAQNLETLTNVDINTNNKPVFEDKPLSEMISDINKL